ncbi:hypothetical protein SMM_0160 [Spiroplasma mirum ATCC 29335]|nr:hypothetical protein SMM_0160 [Spiroplasma mirum ATCC 29335]
MKNFKNTINQRINTIDLQNNQQKAYQLLVIICWVTSILTFLTRLFIWVPITVLMKRKLEQNEKTSSEGIKVLAFTLQFCDYYLFLWQWEFYLLFN